jgi:acetyl-CoA C-acetyltransferase
MRRETIMRDVYLIGVGQTPVYKESQQTPVQLAAKAIDQAIAAADIERDQIGALYVGNMMSGMLSNQAQLGPVIADRVGLAGIEALAIDAACASGGNALRLGFLAVAGGFHDAVVAAGVEVMTHVPRERITQALATGSDWETEGSQGESFISLNARLMRNYMDKYRIDSARFGHFSVNAHANACTNPNAMLHKAMTHDDYNSARLLNDPIKLSDSPPISDGAAAVVIANCDVAFSAMRNGFPAIRVVASAVATDRLISRERWCNLELSAVRDSSRKAYEQARVGPADLDFFELHDAYTIITALSLEAAGFADAGRGAYFGADGEITLGGELPISTMGGLKARGHPVGATGLYQTVEAYLQLIGQAGANQIPDCHIGMVQSIGGTGATVVTHILENG